MGTEAGRCTVTVVGVARRAPVRSWGVDSLAMIPDAGLDSLVRRGITFIGAYIEILAQNPSYAKRIHDKGLAIWPILLARTGTLNATAGRLTGEATAHRAGQLGIPSNVHLCIDDEDTHGTNADVLADRAACAEAMFTQGWPAALYVGMPQSNSGAELGALQHVTSYARSCSRSVVVPGPRGFSLFQSAPGNELDPETGMRLDWDCILEEDTQGQTPVLWYPE
jgi:hypothetical protein